MILRIALPDFSIRKIPNNHDIDLFGIFYFLVFFYFSYGSLNVTGLDAPDGLPTPAAFWAETRN